MRFWVTKTYSSRSSLRFPSALRFVDTTWTALCPASSTSPLVSIFFPLALSFTLFFTRRRKSSRNASTWNGISGPLLSTAETSMARRRPFTLFSPRSTATGLIPKGYSSSSAGIYTRNPLPASVKATTSSLPATGSVTGYFFSASDVAVTAACVSAVLFSGCAVSAACVTASDFTVSAYIPPGLLSDRTAAAVCCACTVFPETTAGTSISQKEAMAVIKTFSNVSPAFLMICFYKICKHI